MIRQGTPVLNQISLKPALIAWVLGLVAFFLIIASVIGQLIMGPDLPSNVKTFINYFYVDYELNFPTGFSSFLLLISALLLLVITILESNRSAPYVPKWALLSFCFLCLSTDEALQFHEKLIQPMRIFLGDSYLSHLGIFYWPWVIPGIVTVLIFAIYFSRFLLKLNLKSRLSFLIAAVLYVSGAIGFELIGARYVALHGENLTYTTLITTVEEGMEMSGVIVFIWALLVYISDNFMTVQIQFTNSLEQSLSDTKA